MNQEYVQNLFERKTNNILASLSYNGLDNYVSRIYNQKVPDYIKQYLAPERKYIDNLAHELNGHIYGMQRNFFKNIRDNPKEAMKKTLEELLFSSKEKKEEFGAKVSDTVEELSYAAQVMAAKGYEIWTVKYNTPVVGNFARRELRRRTGREDLPTFEETKRNIDALKQSTYNFLEYTGFDSHHRMPEESVKQWQAHNMFIQCNA